MKGQDDEDELTQLHCTTLFEPDPEHRVLSAWNLWCEDQTGLVTFCEAALASAGYEAGLLFGPLSGAKSGCGNSSRRSFAGVRRYLFVDIVKTRLHVIVPRATQHASEIKIDP